MGMRARPRSVPRSRRPWIAGGSGSGSRSRRNRSNSSGRAAHSRVARCRGGLCLFFCWVPLSQQLTGGALLRPYLRPELVLVVYPAVLEQVGLRDRGAYAPPPRSPLCADCLRAYRRDGSTLQCRRWGCRIDANSVVSTRDRYSLAGLQPLCARARHVPKCPPRVVFVLRFHPPHPTFALLLHGLVNESK